MEIPDERHDWRKNRSDEDELHGKGEITYKEYLEEEDKNAVEV